VSPTATSDHHDAALQRKREVMDRLRSGDRQLGLAALEAFHSDEERSRGLDMALLELAAHCAPEQTLPELEQLVLVYGTDLGIRTHAAALLGETSPERARELLAPILRQPRGSSTYPPREALLNAWINASTKVDAPMDDLLAEIATNLFQPPEVRYLAIEGLARAPTPLAIQALEEVLVESSSDAYQRRKAAQAIRDGLPQEQACAILERVADRESDEDFILFLADMIEKHCF
jgi:HEAT repeat protein